MIEQIIGFVGNRIRRLYRQIMNKPDVDWVTKYVGVGGYSQFNILHTDVVIDLRKLPEGPGISPEIMDKFVDAIAKHVFNGSRVAVHCRVGRGRAPMIVIAYLFKYNNDTIATASHRVMSKRPFVSLTNDQISSLAKYRDWILKNCNCVSDDFYNYCR